MAMRRSDSGRGLGDLDVNDTWIDREPMEATNENAQLGRVVVGNDDVWVVVRREERWTDETPGDGSWEIIAPLRVCREVRDGYVVLGEVDPEFEADGPDFEDPDPREA